MAYWYQYRAAAQVAFESGRITASWLHLLHAEFQRDEQTGRWLKRKSNTPRQKEVQRLWQQRGLLERTKANLLSVHTEGKNHRMAPLPYSHGLVNDCLHYLERCISVNKQNMSSIKERIPK